MAVVGAAAALSTSACTVAELERLSAGYEPGSFSRAFQAGMGHHDDAVAAPGPTLAPQWAPAPLSVPRVSFPWDNATRAEPREHEAERPPRRERRRDRAYLLCVSGFSGSGHNGPKYLAADAGPCLSESLTRAGFDVVERHYENHDHDYRRLIADLRAAGADTGSPIVLVGHSQGGVWTHAAARDCPDVEIAVLVDLDTTSYGWALRSTPSIGDPRSAYNVRGRAMDLEDVVIGAVRYNLEVRSGEQAFMGNEPYDEDPNVAVSGGCRVTTWDVETSHTEVHTAGRTMRRVCSWVVSRVR